MLYRLVYNICPDFNEYMPWVHHVMGFNSPTDNLLLCQRLCETETTKKEPITSNVVKPLVTKAVVKNSTIPDLRFLLACLLGFAGFLVIDDLLNVKLNHKKLQESHLEILVPKSKTNQDREGHVVYTSRIKSECRLVKY